MGDPNTTTALPGGPAPGPAWVETWAHFWKGLERCCYMRATSEGWQLDLCWCSVRLKDCSGNYYLSLFPTGLIRWAKDEGELKSSPTSRACRRGNQFDCIQMPGHASEVLLEGERCLCPHQSKEITPDTKVIWQLQTCYFLKHFEDS